MHIDAIANDMRYADHRHPVDSIEPLPEENSDQSAALAHALVWLVQSVKLSERGLRSTVAAHCLRPDLVDKASLQQAGIGAGFTPKEIGALVVYCEEVINHG